MKQAPSPDAHGPARWTGARLVTVAFVTVWLVIQVGVPAAALLTERPDRFSWQMFSGLTRHPHYVVVHEDRAQDRESHGDLLPWVRADVDYPAHVPEHLCDTRDGAVEVRVVPRDDEEPERVHRCDPPAPAESGR